MRLFAIVALLVVVSSVGAAQDRTKAEAEYIQRCKLKAKTHAVRGKSPEFHFRKGEKYEHSPIIAYEILESGEIAHAFMKRSSGVADLDHYALMAANRCRNSGTIHRTGGFRVSNSSDQLLRGAKRT